MASRKNRSRKANRKSPKAAPTLRERLQRRFNAVVTWIDAHRWHAIAGGLVLLFVASLFGGYWIAERLELVDRDRLARATMDAFKPPSPPSPSPTHPRILAQPCLPTISPP